MRINPRSLLLATALTLPMVFGLGPSGTDALAGTNETPVFQAKVPVKHIILFVGDGMHLEHEIATSRYLYGQEDALSFHQFPYQGAVATWDVSTYNKYATTFGQGAYDPKAIVPTVGYDPAQGGILPYPLQTGGVDDDYFIPPSGAKPPATDSASAATAWSTGFKTDDGNVAWQPSDPANGSLRTIAEILRDAKGFAIGVVSTVPFSHATPAAFVSHNVNRNDYAGIAGEILNKVKPDVVIGGGYPFAGKFTYLAKETYDAFKNDMRPDYVFVERSTGVDGSTALLAAAQAAAQNAARNSEPRKLFGLFGGAGGNFESPEPGDFPGTPFVSRGSAENPTLAAASLAALKVLSEDPEGLFLMIEQGDIDWANHANDFQRMIGTTADLDEAVRAVVNFINQEGDDITWANTLLLVTADHANSYMRLQASMASGALPEQEGVGVCGYSSNAPCTYPDGEVTYATTNHTNELVRVYATGYGSSLLTEVEGAWYPCTRVLDNTQLFHVMAKAAGAPQESELRLVIAKWVNCSRSRQR